MTLTIDEAIEYLTSTRPLFKAYFTDDIVAATELGAEALKAWDEQRKYTTYHHIYLLPGETKA